MNNMVLPWKNCACVLWYMLNKLKSFATLTCACFILLLFYKFNTLSSLQIPATLSYGDGFTVNRGDAERTLNHLITSTYAPYKYKAETIRFPVTKLFGFDYDQEVYGKDHRFASFKTSKRPSISQDNNGSSGLNSEVTHNQSTTLNDSESLGNTDLILSAYMRSGSTIIGKLFGHRLDTFYLFEPLWGIAKFQFYKGNNSLCHYYRPHCVNISDVDPDESISPTAVLNFLQSFLDCKFYNFSGYLFDKNFEEFSTQKHDWIFRKGYGWKNYNACAQKNNATFISCLRATTSTCTSSKHRVIKLLRMTIDNLDILLERNKKLKIIHLFRDPRGILNSHLKTSWFGRNDKTMAEFVRNDSKVMCERMMIDLKSGKILQAKFPGRIKFIQYEDLGNILQNRMHVLNDFARFELSKEQSELINGSIDTGQYTDQRGFHPYSYRNSLSWDVVRICDSECSDLLTQLGYTLYENEVHLRNMSQPAAVDPLPFAV